MSVALNWSNALSVGVTLDSKVNVEFVEESIGFSINDAFTFGETTTTTNTATVGDSYTQTIPPYTHMEGETIVTYGSITLPFTATLQIGDRQDEQFTEEGVLTADNCYQVDYKITNQTPIQH